MRLLNGAGDNKQNSESPKSNVCPVNSEIVPVKVSIKTGGPGLKETFRKL